MCNFPSSLLLSSDYSLYIKIFESHISQKTRANACKSIGNSTMIVMHTKASHSFPRRIIAGDKDLQRHKTRHFVSMMTPHIHLRSSLCVNSPPGPLTLLQFLLTRYVSHCYRYNTCLGVITVALIATMQSI